MTGEDIKTLCLVGGLIFFVILAIILIFTLVIVFYGALLGGIFGAAWLVAKGIMGLAP